MILRILLDILGPLLLMIGLGAIMRRKFQVDIGTLSKLNIYLFVPVFIFDRVVSSATISWGQMGGIVAVTLLQSLSLGLLVGVVGRALRVEFKTLATMALSVMLYNSANYGLPLAELAYGEEGAAVQTFVAATQNLLTFTVGMTIAAWAGSGDIAKGLIHVFRTPVLPMLAIGLLTRYLTGGDVMLLPIIIRKTTGFLAGGLVPLALLTLGAQLAASPRWPRWRPVSLVLVLRLLFAPAWMAGMLYLFHRLNLAGLDLWARPAEFLILTSATPTAVNSLLLSLEMGGDAELSADCVFWSTVLSLVTTTTLVAILRLTMSGP